MDFDGAAQSIFLNGPMSAQFGRLIEPGSVPHEASHVSCQIDGPAEKSGLATENHFVCPGRGLQ